MRARAATETLICHGSLFLCLGLAVAALLRAEPARITEPAPNVIREHRLTAESFVTEKVWLWQRRLSLTAWHIQVKLARTTELRPKTLGNIHWDAGHAHRRDSRAGARGL